jgi:hypothetical protein
MIHRRYHAVEYMEVRTADRAGSHLDDRILVMLDFRIRYAFAADIVLAVLGERLHSVLHSFGNTNDRKPHCSIYLGTWAEEAGLTGNPIGSLTCPIDRSPSSPELRPE